MSTVVSIAGTAVDTPGKIVPQRMTAYVRGGIPSFTFQTRGGKLPGLPDPYLGKTVSVAIGGTTYFQGDVVSAHPEYQGQYGWVITYQCLGLRNRADWFPHTDANTGIDLSIYNASPEDPTYIAARAGRTVGQIIQDVLTMTANATNLNSLGLGAYTTLTPPTLPSQTLTDLAALSIIPPAPVYFRGEKIGGALEAILASWAPNFTMWIEPDTGAFRFLDTRAFTDHTLTLGTDPIEPTPISRDVSDCYTAVIVRGQPWVVPMMVSLSNGGLQEDFAWGTFTNAQAKVNWVPSDFQQPGNPNTRASDRGSCTCPSTTTVTVTSADSSLTWVADYWDQTSTGRHGVICLCSSVNSSINQYYTARIVANTALTAGGTSTLTLDIPLPITTYDSYAIFGLTGDSSIVWRKYKVTNTNVGAALASQFTYPVPYVNSSDTAASLVSVPTGSVLWSANGSAPFNEFPLPFTQDPTSGTILFVSPTYFIAGNAQPADVRALLAVNTQALRAQKPSSGFQGTAFTVEGYECTWIVTVDSWRDPGNQAAMDAYAQDLLDSVKDTVLDGSVVYEGLYATALKMGIALNITGATYTTGWEAPLTSFTSVGIPVVECTLEWLSGSGPNYRTTMRCNSKRMALSPGAFMKPDRTGQQIGGEEGGGFAPIAEFLESHMVSQTGQFLGGGGADLGAMGPGDMGSLNGLGGFLANPMQQMANLPTNPGDYLNSMGLPTAPGQMGLPMGPADLGLPTSPGDFLNSQGIAASPSQYFGGIPDATSFAGDGGNGGMVQAVAPGNGPAAGSAPQSAPEAEFEPQGDQGDAGDFGGEE